MKVYEEYKAFFGIPVNEENPNFYVLGIPWDSSSSYRRGAAEAPSFIRKSTSSEIYNIYSENLVNLGEFWRLKDLGDLKVTNKNIEQVYKDLRRIIEKNYKDDRLFLFMGGDHIITYLCIKALKKTVGGEWGLLYFDSHPDLYKEYEGDPYSHACVVRRIVEEKLISPENIVEIGIRAPTREQMEFAKEHNIKILSTRDLYSPNIKSNLRLLVEELNSHIEKAYLSIDLDVLDPSYAPGVGNPEPGGISTRQLIDTFYEISSFNIKSFDVVELCPKYDPSGITGFAVAKIIREILGIVAKKSILPDNHSTKKF